MNVHCANGAITSALTRKFLFFPMDDWYLNINLWYQDFLRRGMLNHNNNSIHAPKERKKKLAGKTNPPTKEKPSGDILVCCPSVGNTHTINWCHGSYREIYRNFSQQLRKRKKIRPNISVSCPRTLMTIIIVKNREEKVYRYVYHRDLRSTG
jgi:hypothetical protein